MKHIKNIIACTFITSILLSASSCVAFNWRDYKPGWDTWQRVRGSYIDPAWQRISNISPDYAKALGSTALTSLTVSPGKLGMLLSAQSVAEPIYNRYMQRETIAPQERSKLDYLADIGGHTLAAVLPLLISLYKEGKIDAKILYRIITDPMVLTTAGASVATGLAAAGFEWLNEPINIETSSVEGLKKRFLALQAKKESLNALGKKEGERIRKEWEDLDKTLTAQKEIIDKEVSAIADELKKRS